LQTPRAWSISQILIQGDTTSGASTGSLLRLRLDGLDGLDAALSAWLSEWLLALLSGAAVWFESVAWPDCRGCSDGNG